ncbi:MAG: PAP/fibrillin family protein [Prochlorothrix sp.]
MPTLTLPWLPKWLNFGQRKAEVLEARLQAKKALLDRLIDLRTTFPKLDNAPLTHLDLGEERQADLETLITQLEEQTPYPAPLRQGSELLNGTWILIYSDAQEISRLATLPLGLRTGQVSQIVDVETLSFENKANVRHQWQLLSGFVRVTAVFEPTPNLGRKMRNRRIDVDFQTRFFSITKMLGIPTPFFDPIRTVDVNNPPEVVPSLEITYLDEEVRIGRGGEGSLFVLIKEEAFTSLLEPEPPIAALLPPAQDEATSETPTAAPTGIAAESPAEPSPTPSTDSTPTAVAPTASTDAAPADVSPTNPDSPETPTEETKSLVNAGS